MTVLLSILSVLAVWALLGVLLVGLWIISKALEGVRTSLEKVAAGVRAIETQTQPLAPQATRLSEMLGQTAGSLDVATERLAVMNRNLDGPGR